MIGDRGVVSDTPQPSGSDEIEHLCRDCGGVMEPGRYSNGSRKCRACAKASYARTPSLVLTPEMEADAHG